MAEARISVVIATLGRPSALAVCLQSLCRQTHLPDEVLVVYNGTDPATRDVCERHRRDAAFPIRYFSCDVRGAAPQRDFGVHQASGDLILFTDDDVELEPDWIEQLFAVVNADAATGAAMGALSNQPTAPPTATWRVYRRLVARAADAYRPGAIVGALVPNGFPPERRDPIPSEWIGGGVTLLRKAAYLSVNGFAAHYRGSSPGEDLDLGFRISRRWKVFYVPTARCVHHEASSGREQIARHQYLSMRSRYGFCRSSVGMSVIESWWQIGIWALFQTASEVGQLRHGRLRADFLTACWGRIHGALSCIGWNPAAEPAPDWRQRRSNG